MTAADLALVAAFWLLLMLLRLPLRVDPRYRGRRRVGRTAVPMAPISIVPEEPTMPVIVRSPEPPRVAPYVPPPFDESQLDKTSPLYITKWQSLGRYEEPRQLW